MKKLINSITVAHLLRAAFSLTLIFIAVQLIMPLTLGQRQTPAKQSFARQSAPGTGCSWTSGFNMPTPTIRAVGVYFPANGKFYAMGGSTSDSPNSDLVHPYEYNPVTDMWTTKTASYPPDHQVNDMACGVLSDGATPYIYCVGGSAAGQTTATNRVFRYDPINDNVETLNLAYDWRHSPFCPSCSPPTENILPGGFTVVANKLYILGGFQINTGVVNSIWEFSPTGGPPVCIPICDEGTIWTQKTNLLTPGGLGYIPTAAVGCNVYMAGGSTFTGGVLTDSTNSFNYDSIADTITPIALSIPRATAETRGLQYHGQVWVLGGGSTAPGNPSNEVDIYDPVTQGWTTGLPFNTARRSFAADTDANKIFLAGGYDSSGNALDSMEIYSCTAPTPTVVSAVSRKNHGGVGIFDIDLPLTGTPGIECRCHGTGCSAGGTNDYTMVVTFSGDVTGSPQAEVICGTGCVGSGGLCNGGVSISGTTVTIPLTMVADQQTIVVRLNGVTEDGFVFTDFTIPMVVLIGDVNANGRVNSGDTALVKTCLGLAVTAANFRCDIDANGSNNSTDKTLAIFYTATGLW